MKNKILYLECHSGISGDMTVGALLDLGADRKVLEQALKSLPLDGYSIEIKDVFKSGIRACDFHVKLDAAHENHDHDMEYLHNHALHDAQTQIQHTHAHQQEASHDAHAHQHTTAHAHEYTIAHPHHQEASVHDHCTHAHEHTARNLNDIIAVIRAGALTENAKKLAIRIFKILAKAEATVHGKRIDEVHFHEVGAVDSIVDIVAAAVCIDNLNADAIIVSPLTDGQGQIRCQHGLIPVPVPAVAAIAVNEGLTLKSSATRGELVTPTGAAIAAAVSTGKSLPEEYKICKMGFGAGKRDYETAGILRAMLIEPAFSDTWDTILTLETNIDDCTGEALSYTMQLLFEAGALDVFYVPIYMKKSRPACLLKVICRPEDRTIMEAIIFQNTTTIGIRASQSTRTKLERRILAIETPWGMADVKCCTHGQETYYYPENDSICRLAAANKTGFPEMYHMVQAYARDACRSK
ncbi:nickel pincer cofactor biosynthesis protein LarC [Parablautia sp. Marseille-Q6255]|uniref:nickel pincer cofactor biosynthesis protein LarC n=1 Tax=Parablautia sp. Marseille-Q6255 TaxID=3039593 RepID=UPI0024BC3F9C|nr:nickel pincer cofactor biosynthesis protein LarC [Parablautia sp. Marseille-Q6255]